MRVYYEPPPFVRTKLFLADDYYAHIGPANIDPRSLRLNFALAIEIYDKAFAAIIAAHFENGRRQSREILLEDVDACELPVGAWDALARLFSPYL